MTTHDIGRLVEGGLRELIISCRCSGYLARYAWDDASDWAMVASIRYQREAGYTDAEI